MSLFVRTTTPPLCCVLAPILAPASTRRQPTSAHVTRAVDVDRRAGRVSGETRSEEGDDIRHVLRVGHFAEPGVARCGLDAELLREGPVEVGIDVAGREGEGRDALAAVLAGGGPRHPPDAGLCG